MKHIRAGTMKIQQWFNKESIGKSAAILTSFTVSEKIIQISRGIIFARLLGPAEYGVYNLAFFFIPLAVTFARLGIPSCFTRYIPQYEIKNALQDFLKKTYLLVLAGGLGAMLICVIYAVVLNVTGFIFAVGMIAGNVLTPNLSEYWEKGKKEKVIKTLKGHLQIEWVNSTHFS